LHIFTYLVKTISKQSLLRLSIIFFRIVNHWFSFNIVHIAQKNHNSCEYKGTEYSVDWNRIDRPRVSTSVHTFWTPREHRWRRVNIGVIHVLHKTLVEYYIREPDRKQCYRNALRFSRCKSWRMQVFSSVIFWGPSRNRFLVRAVQQSYVDGNGGFFMGIVVTSPWHVFPLQRGSDGGLISFVDVRNDVKKQVRKYVGVSSKRTRERRVVDECLLSLSAIVDNMHCDEYERAWLK
jgi:hypothetical protein